MKIKNFGIVTTHLNLENLEQIKEELNKQSAEDIITHVGWTHFHRIWVQHEDDGVSEAFKDNYKCHLRLTGDYCARPSNDTEIQDVVRKYLSELEKEVG